MKFCGRRGIDHQKRISLKEELTEFGGALQGECHRATMPPQNVRLFGRSPVFKSTLFRAQVRPTIAHYYVRKHLSLDCCCWIVNCGWWLEWLEWYWHWSCKTVPLPIQMTAYGTVCIDCGIWRVTRIW